MAQQTQRAAAPSQPLPPIPIQRPRPFWASWRFILMAIIIAAGFGYGWHLTAVDPLQLVSNLPRAGHIVSQLVRPDFFKRDMTVVEDSISLVVPRSGETPVVLERSARPGPQLEVSNRIVRQGETITLTGSAWPPNAEGVIKLGDVTLSSVQTDAQGAFSVPVTLRADESAGNKFLNVVFETPLTWAGGISRWTLSDAARLSLQKIVETIFLAFIGTIFSVVISAPLSFLGARNVMHGSVVADAVYWTVRTVFNVLRSIEVLIIVVIMAVVVGIGSFAGVLAIAIHGIGALGKLYSESIEAIDPGPIEAIRATGATRLQQVMYSVLPQVIPAFISFTFYRWDINVRMATVIGLVGGGGIGFILNQYMNLLLWRQAAVAIWFIIVVVMAMDYASSWVRHKIV